MEISSVKIPTPHIEEGAAQIDIPKPELLERLSNQILGAERLGQEVEIKLPLREFIAILNIFGLENSKIAGAESTVTGQMVDEQLEKYAQHVKNSGLKDKFYSMVKEVTVKVLENEVAVKLDPNGENSKIELKVQILPAPIGSESLPSKEVSPSSLGLELYSLVNLLTEEVDGSLYRYPLASRRERSHGTISFLTEDSVVEILSNIRNQAERKTYILRELFEIESSNESNGSQVTFSNLSSGPKECLENQKMEYCVSLLSLEPFKESEEGVKLQNFDVIVGGRKLSNKLKLKAAVVYNENGESKNLKLEKRLVAIKPKVERIKELCITDSSFRDAFTGGKDINTLSDEEIRKKAAALAVTMFILPRNLQTLMKGLEKNGDLPKRVLKTDIEIYEKTLPILIKAGESLIDRLREGKNVLNTVISAIDEKNEKQ
ncbi:hypothetical protein Theam_0078 [Thermovibrio ammonificans HB-1]|uniref:Uncharacterized protein n=1 Tax=Thermovibrio ammonificans (strain DSM 15698 / JCM 12110 / HB-1) TaxID=648996 RepID=E8T347_THEA1|nr:hypothetical protein [Thermovibrio ammonificans]ADU96052.1 hypothetical protein Theam_0078 [Thermovibrio ammonificans HB-1]